MKKDKVSFETWVILIAMSVWSITMLFLQGIIIWGLIKGVLQWVF